MDLPDREPLDIEDFTVMLSLMDFAEPQRFSGSVWLWSAEARLVGGRNTVFPRIYIDMKRRHATVAFMKYANTFDTFVETFSGPDFLQETLRYITHQRYSQNGNSKD